MTPPDSAIVRRVLAGDTDAFARLVDAHYERCLRLAWQICGTREDAEDVVQESFLRAFRSLARYEERERFAAWLVRIVVNQCRTMLTRRRRASTATPLWDEPSALADDDGERAARADALARALATLGAEQREAIVLRFAGGLSYEEMAAATGVGVSALKMRVQRACARLRTLLEEAHRV